MRTILLTLATLAALTMLAGPAAAQFEQDPGQQCLCPDDPFCNCTGGTTGGTSGSGSDPYPGACQRCKLKITWIGGDFYEVTYRCVVATNVGIYKRDCYIQPDGSCQLSGDSCAIVLA